MLLYRKNRSMNHKLERNVRSAVQAGHAMKRTRRQIDCKASACSTYRQHGRVIQSHHRIRTRTRSLLIRSLAVLLPQSPAHSKSPSLSPLLSLFPSSAPSPPRSPLQLQIALRHALSRTVVCGPASLPAHLSPSLSSCLSSFSPPLSQIPFARSLAPSLLPSLPLPCVTPANFFFPLFSPSYCSSALHVGE